MSGDRLVSGQSGLQVAPCPLPWPLCVQRIGEERAPGLATRALIEKGFGHQLMELFAGLEYFKRSKKVQTAFPSSIHTESNWGAKGGGNSVIRPKGSLTSVGQLGWAGEE